MFQFANPQYLYLLIPVLLAAVLEGGMRITSRRREKTLGDIVLLRRLTPDRSRVRSEFKRFLVLLAATALVFVLARPQVLGGGTSQDKRKGIEIILMLDVSNSMLSNDIQPSRLERSKLLVSTLIDRLSNDKVGLGVFAGEAYPLLPITNDFVSAKMFLDGVSADMVSLQGTSLSAAIELASKSFTQEKGVGKAIVIITDGEDHEDGAIEAAKQAAKDGRRVYILGVGSTQGGTIPTANGPLCDQQGQVVLTRVNAELGQQVAEAGKGMYIPVDNTNLAQDQLQGALKQLKQKESLVASDDAADEQFQAIALIALLLLLLEFFIMETKNPLFRRLNLFNRHTPFLLLLACTLCSSPAHAQSAAYRFAKQGNRAFRSENYKDAEKCYLKALQEEPRNARIRFNLADTYLAENQQQEAMKQYAEAAKAEQNKIVKAMSFHNMGYIHHKQKQYDKAIDYYKEALRNNPSDEDTRYNLALCQRQKKEQQQQQQQQNQEQQKQNQDRHNQDEDKDQPEQPDQMSQESVDQLLQLSRQSENQTRKKLQEQQPRKKSLPKNW